MPTARYRVGGALGTDGRIYVISGNTGGALCLGAVSAPSKRSIR